MPYPPLGVVATHFILLLMLVSTLRWETWGASMGMGRGHGVPIRTEDEVCASRWSGSTCSPQGGIALDMFTPPSHLLHPPSVYESNAAPKTLALLTRKLHVKRNTRFSLIHKLNSTRSIEAVQGACFFTLSPSHKHKTIIIIWLPGVCEHNTFTRLQLASVPAETSWRPS